MELSTDMIMEIALNTAGYMSAGLLLVVVFSMFWQKQVVAPVETIEMSQKQSPDTATAAATPVKDNETVFIPLNANYITGPSLSNARRNRGEVISLARQMLNSGTPGEKIKQLLPISEGELSVLIMDN